MTNAGVGLRAIPSVHQSVHQVVHGRDRDEPTRTYGGSAVALVPGAVDLVIDPVPRSLRQQPQRDAARRPDHGEVAVIQRGDLVLAKRFAGRDHRSVHHA